MTDFPRRNRIDKLTASEKLIHDAIQGVEAIGSHPQLTDIVMQLVKVKNDLADFLESPVHTDTSPMPINGKCPPGYYKSADGKTCILDA